jgi:hypothetical protein
MSKLNRALPLLIILAIASAISIIQPARAAADFSINYSPATSLATYNINVTSSGGFTGTVNLAAIPLSPQGLTTTLAKTSVTVPSGGFVLTTLKIQQAGAAPGGFYSVNVTGTATISSTSVTHAVIINANLVYISPPSRPSSTSGTTIFFLVKVANIDPFNLWDIAIKTDAGAINPASFSISGNLLAANFSSTPKETIHCVNNVGTSCVAGIDGPGVVHSEVTISGPPPMIKSTSGLLFNITYTTGTTTSSIIHFSKVLFSNGSSIAVAVNSQDGFYGTNPSFTATPNPAATTLTRGTMSQPLISLAGINGFTGTVNLAVVSVTPTITSAPTASISPSSVTLTGGTGSSTLTTTTTSTTPFGVYVVKVNATAVIGTIGFSQFPIVSVLVPDFSAKANPNSLTLAPPGTSAKSNITLTSLYNFAGPVVVNSIILGPSGTPPTISPTSTTQALTAGGTASFNITISTISTTTTGTYSIKVNATAGSTSNELTSTHTIFITVLVQFKSAISTTLSSTTILTNGAVHDSATLTGVTSTAGGTVIYNWTNGTCAATSQPQQAGFVFVNNGAVPDSLSVGGTTNFWKPGTYGWNATYSGDPNNTGPITSSCETLTVLSGKASPTLATTLSATTIPIGGSVHDTATLSGATSSAGGTVTYQVWNGTSTCFVGPAAFTFTVNVVNGNVPDSTPVTFTSLGSFSWNATYSGDTVNKPAALSSCEILTVIPTSPTITTTLSATTVTSPAGVHDSATLAGAFNPTGTVTYNIVQNGACSGPIPFSPPQTVTISNGIVPDSATVTFTVPGTYGWNATYSGDSNNNPSKSICEQLTVVSGKTTPTLATTLSATTIPIGGSAHDSAKLTGATSTAGGTLTYQVWNATSTCFVGSAAFTFTVNVVNGNVPNSTPVTFTSLGSFSWNATYNGDTNNNPATLSSCEVLTVTPTIPTLVTTISSPITVGSSASDSATLTGGFNAGGTVTYEYWNATGCTGSIHTSPTPVTVTNGVIPNSLSVKFTAAGLYSWNATYNGDPNNNPAKSACEPLTVNKATPTITTTLFPPIIVVNNLASDSATLSGGFNPAGTVFFSIYYQTGTCNVVPQTTNPLPITGGVPTSSGVLNFTSVGLVSWTATYQGDSNNNVATSSCEILTITKASPIISTTLSATTITSGNSVFDSAVITGATANVGGSVTYSYWTTSTCTGTQITVSTANLLYGIVPHSASKTFNASSYGWTATYNGDANNNPATSPCEPLTVTPVNLGITSITVEGGANSATIGQTVTIDVVVYNNGTTDENFQLTVSWGSVQVAQKNFTLAHGQSSQSQPFTLTWDTTNFATGTDTLSAQIPPAKGETNLNDNTLAGPTFTLSAPGQPGLSATEIVAIAGGVGGAAAIGGGLFFLRRRKKLAAKPST